MSYKAARRVSVFSLFTGLGLLIIILAFLRYDVIVSLLFYSGSILVLLGLILFFAFFRCPQCRSLLPLKNLNQPTYCPNCGTNIEEK